MWTARLDPRIPDSVRELSCPHDRVKRKCAKRKMKDQDQDECNPGVISPAKELWSRRRLALAASPGFPVQTDWQHHRRPPVFALFSRLSLFVVFTPPTKPPRRPPCPARSTIRVARIAPLATSNSKICPLLCLELVNGLSSVSFHIRASYYHPPSNLLPPKPLFSAQQSFVHAFVI
jgi:hypothetical protein